MCDVRFTESTTSGAAGRFAVEPRRPTDNNDFPNLKELTSWWENDFFSLELVANIYQCKNGTRNAFRTRCSYAFRIVEVELPFEFFIGDFPSNWDFPALLWESR